MPIIRQTATDPAEQELTQAVRRVYERYGKDLDAFFRDVREQVKQKSSQQDLPFDTPDNSLLIDRDDNTAA